MSRNLQLIISVLIFSYLVSCEKSTEPQYSANIVISKSIITKDDNNNGIANPGETIDLNVYLKNSGTDKANNIKIKEIKSLSDYITIGSSSHVNFGDILAGQEKTQENTYYNYTFKLSLKSTAPIGDTSKILLTIQDEEANTWQEELGIIVE